MSLPPPSDPYGPPPQAGGQPGGGVPSWGGQQPGFGAQYGQPPQGPPGGPPPWGPQPQWAGPSGPPPGKGGRGKWILGGLAVLVVVALAVVITVLVVRPSGGGPTPTTTNGHSDFASAGDNGPVNIIAEDPTCAAWGTVSREYAASSKAVNWAARDYSVPASSWTPDQRTMYETVGKAMSQAADKTANLAKQTPYRVMRELYGQFIAYAQAFARRVPSYTASDDNGAVETDTIANALANICSAIDYRSAQRIAPLLPDPPGPSRISSPADSAAPARFLTAPNSVCLDWASLVSKFSDDTATWRTVDPKIPATDWNPEQKSINDAVASVMSTNADEMEHLGRQSHNPVLEDFAVLAAQYQRAFVAALPGYTANDNFFTESATFLSKTVDWACKAAG
jgi:hypothetical protein